MEKMMIVEMEDVFGRYWSAPMPESAVAAYIAERENWGMEVSDIDYPA